MAFSQGGNFLEPHRELDEKFFVFGDCKKIWLSAGLGVILAGQAGAVGESLTQKNRSLGYTAVLDMILIVELVGKREKSVYLVLILGIPFP